MASLPDEGDLNRLLSLIAEQQALLAAMSMGSRLIRHRGPVGRPAPYTFTVHTGEDDVTGRPADAACVRSMHRAGMIDLGPRPQDWLAPRELVLTEEGIKSHAAFLVSALDLVTEPSTSGIAADVLGVLQAMDTGGLRLTRREGGGSAGHGVFFLTDDTPVATLTGHVLVTAGFVAAVDGEQVWALAQPGREYARAHRR